MKKRFILFAIIGLMLLALPLVANATSSGECGDNLTWVLDDNGVLTIAGSGDMWNWYGNLPWTSEEVQQVAIEDGVTSISSYAFYYCTNLTSITIPDSVISIGEDRKSVV